MSEGIQIKPETNDAAPKRCFRFQRGLGPGNDTGAAGAFGNELDCRAQNRL